MFAAKLVRLAYLPVSRMLSTRATVSPLTLEDKIGGKSTSVFKKKAEDFFNIKIHGTDCFHDIVGTIEYDERDLSPKLHDLLLNSFDREAIRVFKPRQHKDLPKHAQTFLFKLGLVVNNNYAPVELVNVEEYIHDLMDNVLKAAGFEDGTDLILMPCKLRLRVGDHKFAAFADMEGRRGSEIIWVIDEDKHKFATSWKRGDIQLVANMIAAAQANESLIGDIYPSNMLGIKFEADTLYFYSMHMTREYLDDLCNEEKPCSLEVKKFPKNKTLSLSVVDQRRDLFIYLSALRKYALGLDAKYVD